MGSECSIEVEGEERSGTTWRLGGAIVLGFGLPVLGLWLGGVLLADRLHPARPLGAGAWCLHLTATAVLAGAALIPSHAMALVGGFLFGPGAGLASSLIGILVGAAGGFAASRRWVGEGLRGWLLRGRKRARLQRRLLAGGGGHTTVTIALIRLSPLFTFAATNVLMASARVPLRAFLLGTAIGLVPRTAAAVWVGAELSKLDLRDPPSVSGLVGLGLALALPLIALAVLGVWAGRGLSEEGPER